MMEQDKAEAQLAGRTRVWNEVIEGRKWQIRQIYGQDAADRYHALPREKQYFLLHGHLPSNPNPNTVYEAEALQREVHVHDRDFWSFCEANYAMQRQVWEDRINRNRENAMAQPLYQKQQRDRDELAAYIAEQAKNRKP
jgi:hypothetical protein